MIKLQASDPTFAELVETLRGLAERDDITQQLYACQVNAAATRAEAAAAERRKQVEALEMAQRHTQVFADSLKRKVRRRNDMLADDQDAIGRARGSIALAAAIAAARAAA